MRAKRIVVAAFMLGALAALGLTATTSCSTPTQEQADRLDARIQTLNEKADLLNTRLQALETQLSRFNDLAEQALPEIRRTNDWLETNGADLAREVTEFLEPLNDQSGGD